MDERRPYQRLAVSRGAIDRAGRLLADRLAVLPATIERDVLDAMDVLTDYRDAYRAGLEATVELLARAVSGAGLNGVVGHRLKRTRRIIEKLGRFPGMSLTSMQDIAGCRAIVPDLPAVARVRERILDTVGLTFVREDDYNAVPRDSGYRAHHLIVGVLGTPVEIQLRTAWQQSWTDLVEQLDSDYDVGLKHEGGPEVVGRYLAVFAYAEDRRHAGSPIDALEEAALRGLESEAIAALKTRQARP
jgi:putative GTP pyrophosphokinase